MKIFNKEKEKYYICENCGTLKTESEFYHDKIDRMAYGNKICNCEYGYIRWDNTAKQFLPQHGKSFTVYVEIPKDIYTILHAEDNEILRMKMYFDWKSQTYYKDKVKEK